MSLSKIRNKRIFEMVNTIYPASLLIAIITLVLAFYYPLWVVFVNWWALYIVIAVLTMLYFLNPGRVKILDSIKRISQPAVIKALLISLILIFALEKGVFILDFFVLLFGLVVVLFRTYQKLTISLALASLAIIPILLAMDLSHIAAVMAIYALYFLIIELVLQVSKKLV